MLKNKRIKKNWSDEDVKILIWIISKYSDLHGLRDAGKDLVNIYLFRSGTIGLPFLLLFRGLSRSHACSNGSASRRQTWPPITGARRSQTVWETLFAKLPVKTIKKIQETGSLFLKHSIFHRICKIKFIEMPNNADSIGIAT
jgi:hypothetical protein